MPSEGLGIAEVIALAESAEQGDFSADAEVLRVAKVADKIWEDVSVRAARRGDLALDPAAEYVVVARRECSDWTSDRDRWSDERASWFLLVGGKLAAWDHFAFGPHCGIAESFRPVARRLAEPRHRARPAALARAAPSARQAADRAPLRARARLRCGRPDRGGARHAALRRRRVEANEQLFEVRETTEEERAVYDREARRLGDLRA